MKEKGWFREGSEESVETRIVDSGRVVVSRLVSENGKLTDGKLANIF